MTLPFRFHPLWPVNNAAEPLRCAYSASGWSRTAMRFRLSASGWRCFFARTFSAGLALVFLLGALAQSQAADPAPKRVLMLQSFGLHFKPWTDYAETLRSEMSKQSKAPIEFLDHTLLTARLDDDMHPLSIIFRRSMRKDRPISSPRSAHRPPLSCNAFASAFSPTNLCCSQPWRHVGSNMTN